MLFKKRASLGPAAHGNGKPEEVSSVQMGNPSKGSSHFSWQSVSPETVILHMVSLFPLLKMKNQLNLNTFTCQNIPEEAGSSPHALAGI